MEIFEGSLIKASALNLRIWPHWLRQSWPHWLRQSLPHWLRQSLPHWLRNSELQKILSSTSNTWFQHYVKARPLNARFREAMLRGLRNGSAAQVQPPQREEAQNDFMNSCMERRARRTFWKSFRVAITSKYQLKAGTCYLKLGCCVCVVTVC